MSVVPQRLFSGVRLFSNLAILFAVLVSLLFRSLIDSNNLSWQVVLSVIALMIGIPHGAVVISLRFLEQTAGASERSSLFMLPLPQWRF